MLGLSRQIIGTSLISCLCFMGVGCLQLPRMQKLISAKQTFSQSALEAEEKLEKSRLNLLKKVPAFGFDNVFANWVYLNFAQYFGDDEVRAKTGYALSPEYFEIILKHDPRFQLAYLSLSSSTSIYAGMPERSISITERGLKSLNPWVPKGSYYIWRYKGIDELLFLGNSQAAKKSLQTAADWAKKHPDKESQMSAGLSQNTANFLSRNPNSKLAQISAWTMVLQNGVDKETQKRAILAIQALGGEVVQTPQGNQIKFPQKD
ncbi:hypothetical protein [Brunnivagina elsteri]|uniref:Uncharacterized protein n=1 Tax=Brunnivagina elsteri CCALA 953 TaxID=987040 RepID=A0A2A2TGZ2_9CYAN|nr:hypothetical protein [Calothrix elsteri]PAX52679.1 hypothetical protein CK510_18045 [Calothrix elsteri CCALA 953]